MRYGQEFLSRHVARWRGSGLSKKAYSEQHQLVRTGVLADALLGVRGALDK